MSKDLKQKRPLIGADGEFIEPIPVKEKRKRAPQPHSSTFIMLMIGLASVFVGGISILVLLITTNVEPAPLPTIILLPTTEPFVVQVKRANCDPVYALNGDKMAFIASENGVRNLHIYAIDYNVWCTLKVPVLQHMAWNDDGSLLAFTGVTTTGIELFVMNAYGSDLLQLTDAEGFNIDFPISWSTHEDTIAYTQSTSGYMAVYIINSDGTERKLIYETDRPITSMIPRWGGGQSLVLSHGNDTLPADQAQQTDVYIHDTFNDTAVQITKTLGHDGNATWLDYETDSPMIYLSERDGRFGIYRKRIIEDDSQSVLLTPNDDFVDSPIVSPDQRQFLYLTNSFTDLVVMSADGSNRRVLVKAPSRIIDPQWSPDGQRIAYFLSNESGRHKLNIVDVETGENREITLLEDFGKLEEFMWRPRAELQAIAPR